MLNAPIFIIGPPRCGSTLFYEAMTHYFNFCYFTNEMMQNPYAVPFNVHKKAYTFEYESDFSSNVGKNKGPHAPHEACPFWRRFYPKHFDLTAKQLIAIEEICKLTPVFSEHLSLKI